MGLGIIKVGKDASQDDIDIALSVGRIVDEREEGHLIAYTIESSFFESVEEGQDIPEYVIVLERTSDSSARVGSIERVL